MDFKQKILLSKALATSSEAGSLCGELIDDAATFNEFFEYARVHQQLLCLYRALESADLLSAIPDSVREQLDRYEKRQSKRHSDLLGVLAQATAALSKAGIDFILLKGPVFAQGIYGGRDTRPFDDIDILVSSKDIGRAEQCFFDLGFSRTLKPPPWNILLRVFEHAVELSRDRLKVDLHWQIRNRPAYRLDEDRVRQTAERQQVGGVEVLVLSREYTLVAAILEVAQDIERHACSIKTVIDLYLLVRDAGDRFHWKDFLVERRRENLERIAREVLALVLIVTDSRDEFPILSEAIFADTNTPVMSDEADAFSLLVRDNDGRLNRRWFMAVYPGNNAAYFAWLGLAYLASRTVRKQHRNRARRK